MTTRSPVAVRADAERARILAACTETRGDVQAAAARLGIARRTLWRRIRAHDLHGEIDALRPR